MSDPVLDELHKHINAIADMCNANIKPWEPNSGVRAVRLFNEIARPYIDYMCEYVATRPKFAFPVPWCNRVEGLVPFEESEDYLD